MHGDMGEYLDSAANSIALADTEPVLHSLAPLLGSYYLLNYAEQCCVLLGLV